MAAVFPVGMLAISLWCFNFVGDGLRDALDPSAPTRAAPEA